jgi:hypothetical protein
MVMNSFTAPEIVFQKILLLLGNEKIHSNHEVQGHQ